MSICRHHHADSRTTAAVWRTTAAPSECTEQSAQFIGSFRFEHDQSWTRADEVEARDRRRHDIQAFASGRLLRE